MSELILGKNSNYPKNYSPEILFPIPRSEGRKLIGSSREFKGYDIWNCYEVSWLNIYEKPEVRIFEIYIPSTSPNIVESKSLKLYLFSLNNEKFESEEKLFATVKADLEKKLESQITLFSRKLNYFTNKPISQFEGICLDNIQLDSITFDSSEDILKNESNEIVSEKLWSDLHKTNCLITSQPDWASVQISYKGPKIDRKSLLKYIISHRNDDMFHEHSVEKIFNDLMEKFNYESLTVYARYTRRGGIDINPIRSTNPITELESLNFRLARQ